MKLNLADQSLYIDILRQVVGLKCVGVKVTVRAFLYAPWEMDV